MLEPLPERGEVTAVDRCQRTSRPDRRRLNPVTRQQHCPAPGIVVPQNPDGLSVGQRDAAGGWEPAKQIDAVDVPTVTRVAARLTAGRPALAAIGPVGSVMGLEKFEDRLA